MSNLRMAQEFVKSMRPSWPTPVKYLGGGANGRVYETNDGRLMKFVYDNAPQEYKMLQRLQTKGTHIAPRFTPGNGGVFKLARGKTSEKLRNSMFPNSNNLSNKVTVFVMGRAGNSGAMTLDDYYLTHHLKANTANIQRRVEYLISEMALRGVSHGDLHPGNIIVTVGPSGRILGMWVIDFGRSRVINKGKTERRTHNKLAPQYRFSVNSFLGKKTSQVPVRNGSRTNVNMMNAVYNKRLSPSWERKIATMRKQIKTEMKQYKSPKQTTSPRKTKSLSLTKRRTPSPARPRSAPGRIAGLKVTLKRKRSVA